MHLAGRKVKDETLDSVGEQRDGIYSADHVQPQARSRLVSYKIGRRCKFALVGPASNPPTITLAHDGRTVANVNKECLVVRYDRADEGRCKISWQRGPSISRDSDKIAGRIEPGQNRFLVW